MRRQVARSILFQIEGRQDRAPRAHVAASVDSTTAVAAVTAAFATVDLLLTRARARIVR